MGGLLQGRSASPGLTPLGEGHASSQSPEGAVRKSSPTVDLNSHLDFYTHPIRSEARNQITFLSHFDKILWQFLKKCVSAGATSLVIVGMLGSYPGVEYVPTVTTLL